VTGLNPVDRLRGLVDHLFARHELDECTSPLMKAQLRGLQAAYRALPAQGRPLPSVWDVGFRVFSEDDEDGVILFLLTIAGAATHRFVDVGSGDGVHVSNTANLAFNLGFDGLFVEANADRVAQGRANYERHRDTRARPPRFVQSFVKTSNVDATLRSAGFEGEIDVLSIDIDGNDYWIWEAISAVRARIVVIETHDEYGLDDVLAPYDEDLVWTEAKPGEPFGASPVAMTKLAERLGYRLVAGNRRGFNAIYLRDDLAPELPRIAVSELVAATRYAAFEAGPR
jgi:hypothetical protein